MAKIKSVLGRGLSALIPGASQDVLPEREHEIHLNEHSIPLPPKEEVLVNKIEIARIAPNPLQPRKEFSKETLEELTQSIREHGVIQAVTVRKAGPDRYELVSGERRVRAAIEAGLTEIPAYLIDVSTNRNMLELAIIENVQRQQFNPIEEAEAYERLIDECELTQEEVAEKIGKDRSSVTNFLRLLKLPDEIKLSLRAGELGLGHAKAILSVESHEKQIALWQEAVLRHYSVRKLEEVARHVSQKKSSVPTGFKKTSPHQSNGKEEVQLLPEVEQFQDKLKQILGTQVKIRARTDSTGEIMLDFYSADDLERIVELLLSIRAV